MKVLHVISGMSPHNGGPAFAMKGLAVAQVRAGLDVHIVTTHGRDAHSSIADETAEAGVRITSLGPTRSGLQLHPDMNATVDAAVADAEVVHIHNLWEQLQHVTSRAAHRRGKPYVLRPCGMLDPWSLNQSKWKKKAMLTLRVRRNLNRAAALHFTASIEHELTAPLKLAAPAIIEPNGVDLPSGTDYTRADLQARFPQLAPGPVVTFLSRLHPKKGVDILIDAFDRMLKQWPTDSPAPGLLIVGPDEAGTRAKLEQQIARLGRADRIHLVGLLTGKDKLIALQGADLFCLPSHQENFGIAVVEALAVGTPVVISDQVNIYREIVAEGVGVATPVAAEAVAAAMADWLGDVDRLESASVQARAWATQTYDWNRIAERWRDEHYPRLLA